jgi:hypothetical protein
MTCTRCAELDEQLTQLKGQLKDQDAMLYTREKALDAYAERVSHMTELLLEIRNGVKGTIQEPWITEAVDRALQARQAAKKADGPDVSEPPTESFEKEDDEPLGRASAAPTAQDCACKHHPDCPSFTPAAKATQACEHKTWQFRDPKGWESECADCHITTDELDAAKASNDTREPK